MFRSIRDIDLATAFDQYEYLLKGYLLSGRSEKRLLNMCGLLNDGLRSLWLMPGI
jgi:hypothetical protein